MNYFPFGQQWYILEKFPLHSQGSRFPLMEKGRMCLSSASQVSVQDYHLWDAYFFSSTELSAPMAMDLGSAVASASLEECRNGIFSVRMGMGSPVL